MSVSIPSPSANVLSARIEPGTIGSPLSWTRVGFGNPAATGMRSNSCETEVKSGVRQSPLWPVTLGTMLYSTTSDRGSISEAISASPNRRSRLHTLR